MTTGYEWLHDGQYPGAVLLDGACFTYVRGVTPAQLAREVGLVRPRGVDLSSQDGSLDEVLGTIGSLAMFGEDDWTVAFEPYGDASWAADLGRTTGGREVVVVLWDINDHNEFSYWRSGEHLVSLRGLDLEHRSGTQPEYLNEQLAIIESDLTDGDESYPDVMLVLAERLTRIRIGGDFLLRQAIVAMP